MSPARHLYHCYIWLSDQAEWKLHAVVPGKDESDALARARRDLAAGWPALACEVDSCPASAKLISSAPPSLPVKALQTEKAKAKAKPR